MFGVHPWVGAVETVFDYRCLYAVLLCVLVLTGCSVRTESFDYFDFDWPDYCDFCSVSLSFSSFCRSFSSSFRWLRSCLNGQRVDRKAREKPLRFPKVPEGSGAVLLHDYHHLMFTKEIPSNVLAIEKKTREITIAAWDSIPVVNSQDFQH